MHWTMSIIGGCSFYCLIAFHLNAVLANIKHETKKRVGQYDRTGVKKGHGTWWVIPQNITVYVLNFWVQEGAQQYNEL